MKKIRIPMIIQDPSTTKQEQLPKSFEGYDPVRSFFLDGPVTENVAVLDFDPVTGNLRQGACYNSGEKMNRIRGHYENSTGKDLYKIGEKALYSPEFMQVSVFATVLRTIDLFEKTEEERYNVLGRPLKWAFDGKQLFIIPDAGVMANAFYERDSHSLQFFHFPSLENSNKIIYSCLSRDIVAHETGHAIIDGIAPDLMNNCSPESIAIHESIADLTALLVAFSSHNLRVLILKQNDGSIHKPSHFTYIAEEFGINRGHKDGLRDLLNTKVLDQDPKSKIYKDPHELSEVISGALYEVMIKIHENYKHELAESKEYNTKANRLFSASGKALMRSADRFKQMLFRALDFLPPGEVSFANYYQAVVAAD
ncbi:MAG: hypothetical protein AMS27_16330, partial [Bacteroides sp. SM23_62_1]